MAPAGEHRDGGEDREGDDPDAPPLHGRRLHEAIPERPPGRDEVPPGAPDMQHTLSGGTEGREGMRLRASPGLAGG